MHRKSPLHRSRQSKKRFDPGLGAEGPDPIDQGLVDRFVNGSGQVSSATGEELRHINSGRVQNYAAIMFAGAAILAGAFVILLAL